MRRELKMMSFLIAIFTGLFLFQGCSDNETVVPGSTFDQRGIVTTASTDTKPNTAGSEFLGLSADNELVTYIADPSVKETNSIPVSGLADGERMLAIDVRPSSGVLYGVTDKSLLYTIDPVTGRAYLVSDVPLYPEIRGTTVGMDADPKTDKIRIMTDDSQNLLVDPSSAEVIMVEMSTSPANHAINALAFNSLGTMYAVDFADGNLYVGSMSISSLKPVGSLGLAFKGEGGFDISSDNTMAVAVLYGHTTSPGVSTSPTNGDNLLDNRYRLFNVDLKSGQAQYLGVTDRTIIGVVMLK